MRAKYSSSNQAPRSAGRPRREDSSYGHNSFFLNDTATTEMYTLSLHDALPISRSSCPVLRKYSTWCVPARTRASSPRSARSEEHTSELQSQSNLVCRLLLE